MWFKHILPILALVLLLNLTSSTNPSDTLAFTTLAVTVGVVVYQTRGDLLERLTGIPNLASLDRISANVDRIEVAVNNFREQYGGFSEIQELVNIVDGDISLQLRLQEILKWMNQIGIFYDKMQTYMKEHNKFENVTIENFAMSCASHSRGAINDMIENMYKSITTQSMTQIGVLQMLENNLKQSAIRIACDYQQSPHQLLFNLLENIILTEVKAYATMQHAWMLLKIFKHGNFSEEVEYAEKRYEFRINSTLTAFKYSLESISREIIRCDPAVPTEGETYEQITRFRQGYIENEVNMHIDNKCTSACSDFKSAKQERCTHNTLCERQSKCNGMLKSCIAIDDGSNPETKICLSANGSNRRYDWIQYNNGIENSAVGACKTKKIRMSASWASLFWRCSYCVCICDDMANSESDRYFSLREAVADIRNNKVVTGLRFIKTNRIIHLQISQGSLLSGGTIDSNMTWSIIDERRITEQIRDIDYHELNHNERGIDLDDLNGRKGYALTGVRLRMIKGHLNFQIHTTPFDYKTGKLNINESIWTHTERHPRKKIDTNNRDIPTRNRMRSMPDSMPGQYIEFDHTDVGVDFAQTTIPFIDIQPVVSSDPVLLSGAGLYHKGSNGFGGYIAPKILTYNYAEHL